MRGGSQYAVLGISPSANLTDIRDAQRDHLAQLQKQLRAAQRQIDEVRERVPGLAPALQEVETLRNQETAPSQLAAAERTLAALEAEARRVNPKYAELVERVKRLNAEINDLNKLDLANPAKRLEYDRANPPFEMLKIVDCERTELNDPVVAMALLRKELTEFLEAAGECVDHPSDLTRRDFQNDYSFHPLLDGDQ